MDMNVTVGLLKAMVVVEVVVAEVVVADMVDRESLQLVSQCQQLNVLMPQGSDEVILWVLRDTGLVPVGEDLPHGSSVKGEVPVCAGVDERPAHFRVKLFGQVSGSYLPDLTAVHSVQQRRVDGLA